MEYDETHAFAVPETETQHGPVSWGEARPHYFGLTPRGLSAALAAACAVAAIFLFAASQVVTGLLLLVAAAFLAALYFEQARRRRESSLDRVAAAAVDNTRALAGFAGASVRAWTGAGREVARLRLEARRALRERSQLQYALGGATYAGDERVAAELRDRMSALDLFVEESARRANEVVDVARRRTAHERLAVGATEVQPQPPTR